MTHRRVKYLKEFLIGKTTQFILSTSQKAAFTVAYAPQSADQMHGEEDEDVFMLRALISKISTKTSYSELKQTAD